MKQENMAKHDLKCHKLWLMKHIYFLNSLYLNKQNLIVRLAGILNFHNMGLAIKREGKKLTRNIKNGKNIIA